jgi:hypothetical protein
VCKLLIFLFAAIFQGFLIFRAEKEASAICECLFQKFLAFNASITVFNIFKCFSDPFLPGNKNRIEIKNQSVQPTGSIFFPFTSMVFPAVAPLPGSINPAHYP